jgi:hypothetical protein
MAKLKIISDNEKVPDAICQHCCHFRRNSRALVTESVILPARWRASLSTVQAGVSYRGEVLWRAKAM